MAYGIWHVVSESRSERDIGQDSFVRGADLQTESEALVQPVLNAAAEAGAVVPRIEILVEQNRGIDIRAVVAPDLSDVGENDQVQPFRVLVIPRPDGLTNLAREEDRVLAAEAEVFEPATVAASSVERLFIKRNLATALGVSQHGVTSQSQRGLVAEDRNIGAAVEFGLDPSEVRKRVVGVHAINPTEAAVKIPASGQPAFVVAHIEFGEGAVRDEPRVLLKSG